MSIRDRIFWEEKAKELGWKIDKNGRVTERNKPGKEDKAAEPL